MGCLTLDKSFIFLICFYSCDEGDTVNLRGIYLMNIRNENIFMKKSNSKIFCLNQKNLNYIKIH